MNKLSSYLLNEDYHNKRILKEEIIPENKTAIVYHLTGKPWKDETNYPGLVSARSKKVDVEYANAPEYLFHTSLKELGLGKHAAELERLRSKQEGEEGYSSFLNTPQGKAYWIAKKLFTDIYSGGSAFKAGSGDAYGKGLYSCYELNPRIASSYGDVILKFEVDISNFLIFSEDIAKQIHGDNYRLQDQFLSILKRNPLVKREGIDIEALIEDQSTPFGNAMSSFLNMLTALSEDEGEEKNSSFSRDVFKGSKTGVRTAGLTQASLYEFSKLTESNVKLRQLVDGVIFFGMSDGPVCVIYRPETSNNYYPVGAGFFNQDGNAIIVDDLERLRGFKGIKLPLKMRAAKMYKQKEDSPANLKLQNHNDELSKSLTDFINLELEADNDPFKAYLKEMLKEIEKIAAPKSVIDQAIFARLSADKNIPNYCDFVTWFINTIGNTLPKMLEPTIKLINLIGPGLEIINSAELVKYHEIFVETAIMLNNAGFNQNGFDSIIKNRYNLKFNEEFIKIISDNTSTNKIRQEVSNLLGVSIGIFVVYTSKGYKDLCQFALNILGMFDEFYIDMDNIKKFVPSKYNFDLNSFSIDTESEQEKAVIENFKNSSSTKQAIENIADIIDSNLEFKQRFLDLFQDDLKDLYPIVDVAMDKRIILPVEAFTMSFGKYSCDIVNTCTLGYNLLADGGMMQNKIQRKSCIGFEAPAKLIFETNSNLLKIYSTDGYDPSAVAIKGKNILNNSTAIDYPGNIVGSNYLSFKNLNSSMINLDLITKEEVFDKLVIEKSGNLKMCLEMDISQEFVSSIYGFVSGKKVSI